MKRVLLIVFICCWGLAFAGEMEVRSYRVELEDFEYFGWSGGIYDGLGNRMDLYEGKPVKVAPFESRFIEEGDELLDMSGWLRSGGMLGGKGSAAVYNLTAKRLVVKGDVPLDHESLAKILGHRFVTMMKSEVSLYSVPGVKLGRLDGGVEGGRFITSLSCLHLPGQEFEMESEDGGFVVKGSVQLGRSDDLVESRFEWNSELEGARFSAKWGGTTVRGLPELIEIGSLDGKRTLVAKLNQELVLLDGTLLDEWILKEEGGAFLREERLARPRETEDDMGVEIAEGVMRFPVSKTFFSFVMITPAAGYEGDPFDEGKAGEHRVLGAPVDRAKYPELKELRDEVFYDATDFLRKNGVSFGEGGYAFYGEKELMLLVKAPKSGMELIEKMVLESGIFDLPKMIRLDFAQVEAEEKVDGGLLKKGEFLLLRKLGALVPPGQESEVRLGADLAVEVEAQIDANDQLVEMRARLSKNGGDLKKANLYTGLTLKAGTPVVVQQVREDGKWLAWVVTAEILEVGKGR